VRRTFLTPRWLGWHALLLVTLVVLGRVGYWQLEKARAVGDWQNYGYAIQWWLFAGFAVFLWVKMILDELDPGRVEAREAEVREEPSYGPVATQPQAPAPTDEDDDELAAYNRHLARLAEQGRG
jgi:DNA-binding transcriptional regulator of glucitol operon